MQKLPSVHTSRGLGSRRWGKVGDPVLYGLIGIAVVALAVGIGLPYVVEPRRTYGMGMKIYATNEVAQLVAANLGYADILRQQTELPNSTRYQDCLKGLITEFPSLQKTVGTVNEKGEINYSQKFWYVKDQNKMTPESQAYCGIMMALRENPDDVKESLQKKHDFLVLESSSVYGGRTGFFVIGNTVPLTGETFSLQMGPPELAP